MYVHSSFTRLALDETAPVKLTMAPLSQLSLEGVVPSAAAHEVAAVHSLGVPVAHPPHCAQRAGLGVVQAVVRTPV